MSPITLEEILRIATVAQTDLVSQTSLVSYLKQNGTQELLSSLLPASQEANSTQDKHDPLDVLDLRDGKDTIIYLFLLYAFIHYP